MMGRRVSRLREMVGSRTGAILVVAVLCGLLLSGCGDLGETLADLFRINGNGNADAQPGGQEEQLIETFVVTAGTFRLLPDAMPTIEVSEGATTYTLQSAATIDFEPPPGFDQLETGDIVIERPGANTVTVIRDQ